ncbi:RraA family protein [Streptomyces rubiginosohelvolus]|uniref:RraA family protein n=1 Tax=Streptomyces rubiginosohelvolus TaxID=67362 RepID=UPI0036DBEA0B
MEISDLPTSQPRADLIEDRELCDRYAAVPTAAVNDVLRSKGLLHQVLPPAIAALDPSHRVAGIAFTIKGSKNLQLENEMVERAAMLEAIHENAVCVWDTSGDDESAQWGEIMTMAAIRQSARGAIVDGGVRDSEKVLGLGFPVFARYRTSNGMLGRFRMSAWQTPIRIGEVTIQPGDILVGDLDGVIVVPRAIAADVLPEAERIGDDEVNLKAMINDGLGPREVVERGGYF